MADGRKSGTVDHMQPDGSVYTSQRQAVLLFLLPGLLQGLAIYFLIKAADGADQIALYIALLMAACVTPIAHFLTTTTNNRIAALVFSVLLGGATGGLYFVADTAFGGIEATNGAVLFASIAANLLICYIAAPFFRTVFERGEKPSHYPSLFEFAWNLPVIGMAAFGFTLAVWVVLGIWSALFNLLSIEFFRDLFFDEMRAWPITLAAFATAIGIVREREGIVLALRNVLFALLKVISPILTSATVLFVVAALFSGLDALWSGWSATTLMVAAISSAVLLSNAVIGDDGPTQNIILRWSVRVQSFVLPVLAIFAVYGIYIRLKEYGITVERFYALLIVVFAAVYSAAYFLSALRPAAQNFVRQANIYIAGLLFVVAVLVQTPVLNPYKITANDQVARLVSGKVRAADFDFGYLKFTLGPEGAAALKAIEANEAIADRETVLAELERLQAAEGRYEYNRGRRQVVASGQLKQAIEERALELIPADLVLPESFRAYLGEEAWRIRECLRNDGTERCLLAREDGFSSEGAQFVMMRGENTRNLSITLFYQSGEDWRDIGSHYLTFATAEERDGILDAMAKGEGRTTLVPTVVYDVGGQKVFFIPSSREERNVLLPMAPPEEPARAPAEPEQASELGQQVVDTE